MPALKASASIDIFVLCANSGIIIEVVVYTSHTTDCEQIKNCHLPLPYPLKPLIQLPLNDTWFDNLSTLHQTTIIWQANSQCHLLVNAVKYIEDQSMEL